MGEIVVGIISSVGTIVTLGSIFFFAHGQNQGRLARIETRQDGMEKVLDRISDKLFGKP